MSTPTTLPCNFAKCAEIRAERDKAMKALHDLTPGGSEFYNDIERCVAAVRHTRDSLMKQFVSERTRTQVLEAENTRLREALRAADYFLSDGYVGVVVKTAAKSAAAFTVRAALAAGKGETR